MARISRRKFLCGAIALPSGALAHAGVIEPGWLKIKTIQLPKGEKAKHRIAHFTDIHHKGDAAYLRKVVTSINALNPDIVCFTGDLVEESKHVEEALQILKRIKAPLYGIPGNHDEWADVDFDRCRDLFAAQGGKWLMDEEIIVRDGAIAIWGVRGNKPPNFQLQPNRFNLLLSHYPIWVEKIPDSRFDLILSGHSHGGQVRIPGYGSVLVPFNVGQFDMGMYQTRSGPMYVNPGIGYFFLNVRFCCRPEITLFEV